MSGVVGLRWPAVVVLGVASLITVVAFGWPFVVSSGAEERATSHAADAPWLFALLLPLIAVLVLAELSSGGMQAKTVALLGVLSAAGGGLSVLSPGIAGIEPAFLLILLGGRVFGRGFGFVLGALTIVVGALMTGIGPWLPFQMMAAGWVGFLGGCLPARRGRTELVLLALLGLLTGLAYGALLNLWFWPFGFYGPQLSFDPSAGPTANLVHYLRFYLGTSLLWDLSRGIGTAVLALLVGPSLLRALRRAGRRAAFDVEVSFGGKESPPRSVAAGRGDRR